MSFDLNVKLVSGDKFTVKIDPNMTILQVKEIIIREKQYDTTSDRLKLIFKGMNLSNDDVVQKHQIQATSCVICVVSKQSAKKPDAPIQPSVSEPQVDQELLQRLIDEGYNSDEAKYALEVTNNIYCDAILIIERLPTSFMKNLPRNDVLFSIILREDFNELISLFQNNKMEEALFKLESTQPGITNLLRTRVDDLLQLARYTSERIEQIELSEGDEDDEDDEGAEIEDPENLANILQSIDGLPNNEKVVILQQYGLDDITIQQLLSVQTSSLEFTDINNVDNNNINNNNFNNISNHVQLTENENAAVNRLIEIFCLPYEHVIEAFLICDKNEELTANYLTENQY